MLSELGRSLTIGEIIDAVNKNEKLEHYLQSAYENIDELKAENKELEIEFKKMEERAHKAENRVEELEARFRGFAD